MVSSAKERLDASLRWHDREKDDGMRKIIYIMALMASIIPSLAAACMETKEQEEKRFLEFDANKDGYVDEEEWNKKMPQGKFKEELKYFDKDNDKKLSKDEFMKKSFVRGLDCL